MTEHDITGHSWSHIKATLDGAAGGYPSLAPAISRAMAHDALGLIEVLEEERDAFKERVKELEQSGREDLNYMRQERDELRDLQTGMRLQQGAAQADLKEALCQSALDKRQCDDATQEAGRIAVELEEAVALLRDAHAEEEEGGWIFYAGSGEVEWLAKRLAFLSKHPAPSPEGVE